MEVREIIAYLAIGLMALFIGLAVLASRRARKRKRNGRWR